QVTVLEADVLAGVLVRVEGQRLGLVQYLDGRGHHFHLAGADLRVHALAPAHGAGDAQAVLVAHLGRGRDDGRIAGGIGRLGHDLDDALVVAQIDEAQAAQVAGDVGPAAKGDGLPDQGLVDQAAEMGTHGRWGRREQPIILPAWPWPPRAWRPRAWPRASIRWPAWRHPRPGCASCRRPS